MHMLGLFGLSDHLDRLARTGILWRRLIVTLILKCFARFLSRHWGMGNVQRADAGQVSSWWRNGRRGADPRGACPAMARPQRGLVRWAGLIFGGQPERAADLTNERHAGVPVRCAQMAFKGPSTCSELPPRNKITFCTVPEPGDKLQGIQARWRPDCRRHAGVCPTPTDERARERTDQDRRERL